MDRPHTASDPFYLNAAPAIADTEENTNLPNRFGVIQLGDAEGDSEEDDGANNGRKKRKKKKKDKKEKVSGQDIDFGLIFGGNGVNPGPSAKVTLYDSDDDADDTPSHNPRGRGRRTGPTKEFQGLAKVDLTMPLREDEVMPERKHRVVPERSTMGVEQPQVAGQYSDEIVAQKPMAYAHETSKKKQKKQKKSKKKETKNSSRGDVPVVQGSVGDLLDLAAFSSVPQVTAPQPASMFVSSSVHAPTAPPTIQNRNTTISSAFDDLLGFSDNAPIPQLSGVPPAITNGPSDAFGGFSALMTAPPSCAPIDSSGSSGKRPWIRGTIKASHASGSPMVNWSKVQLMFRVYKSSGSGVAGATLVLKVSNYTDTSALTNLTLNLKDFGNVAIGSVTPGSSAESGKIGPFSYPITDKPLELKGTLSTSDCQVPVKLHLPVSMHFSPTEGLALEDVSAQLASPNWFAVSAKLPVTRGYENVKSILSSFLRLAEVEPQLSGPSSGTFAGQSVGSGAQVRLLAKIKTDKLKIDLKVTNAHLAEDIISDLKRLVL